MVNLEQVSVPFLFVLPFRLFSGIMLHLLIAQLVIHVSSITEFALVKMVQSVWMNFDKLYKMCCSFLLILYSNIFKILKFVMKSFFSGFGFFLDEDGVMVKKPQVSNLHSISMKPSFSFHISFVTSCFFLNRQSLKAHIGNNVEIGANSCVDRGR